MIRAAAVTGGDWHGGSQFRSLGHRLDVPRGRGFVPARMGLEGADPVDVTTAADAAAARAPPSHAWLGAASLGDRDCPGLDQSTTG